MDRGIWTGKRGGRGLLLGSRVNKIEKKKKPGNYFREQVNKEDLMETVA